MSWLAGLKEAREECKKMFYEISMLVGKKYWKLLFVWLNGQIGINISYRLDRAMYVIFKRYYGYVRFFFWPIFFLLRMGSSKHSINYKAQIDRGLLVHHGDLGVVISGKSVIGKHFIIVGGNCVGGRVPLQHGDIQIGNYVYMGANATILGPIKIGDGCAIGAGAVVMGNMPEYTVAVGGAADILPRKMRNEASESLYYMRM